MAPLVSQILPCPSHAAHSIYSQRSTENDSSNVSQITPLFYPNCAQASHLSWNRSQGSSTDLRGPTWSVGTPFLLLTLYPLSLPLIHSAPVTVVYYCMYCKHTRYVPVSGPLHLQIPLLYRYPSTWLTHSFTSFTSQVLSYQKQVYFPIVCLPHHPC